MIFKKSKIEKGFEKFILHEFSRLTGIAIMFLSEADGHDLFLDTKSADESDYANRWFEESGLRDKLEGLVEPDEDGIYDLVELSFKKGLADGCLEINKTFVMTKGYQKSLEHLVNYNFNLITKANGETINSIRKTIAQSVASGEGHAQTVKKLSELNLAPSGRVTPRQRANMISRTEVNRAFNTGNLNAYKSWGVSQIDLITAGDNKVCSYCLNAEDNNPHELGKMEPPIHSNCRCTVAAHVDGSPFAKVDKNVSVMADVPAL